MSYQLYNDDNIKVMNEFYNEGKRFDFIYSDCMYMDSFQMWVNLSIALLQKNGILAVQCDYHQVAEIKVYLDSKGLTLVNWCIYLNDWGGVPKKGFPRKHDDILIYSNGDNWKWFGERIQVPKATAGTAFDKKGTGMKTPCDVFYDHASFSTMAKERVKLDGHNVEYQKPQWLMERLILPFTDEGDWVLDNFMGAASTIETCIHHKRNVIGIELDEVKYNLAKERISKLDGTTN
jgi:hypothetical protein